MVIVLFGQPRGTAPHGVRRWPSNTSKFLVFSQAPVVETRQFMTAFPEGIMARYFIAVALMLPLSSALGCRRQGPTTAQTASEPDPQQVGTRVVVAGTVVTPSEALSADEFFDRGTQRFQQRLYTLAAADFEAAARGLSNPTQVMLAWYRAGIARDESGEFATAAANFEQVLLTHDRSAIVRDTHVRLTRLLVYLERWERAGQVARMMSAQFGPLGPVEDVVVKGAMALSALATNDQDAASRDIEAARSTIEEHQFDVPARLQRDVAVVYFALGELRRQRANNIAFVPFPPNFNEQLERRCQLLLDAQTAYSMAMRAYDAHWSVMAGYRVSELYEDLHRDLMALMSSLRWPDAESQQLYEAAFRLRYSILLDKAKTGLDQTLTLAARTDDNSKWVTWAREARDKMQRAVNSEHEALAKVPYSREVLLRALERLKQLRTESSKALPARER